MKKIISKVKPYEVGDIFKRFRKNDLVEYIVKAYKILECEYVELLDYELITDARKYDPEYINPKYIKNPKNKKFPHRLNLKESRYDLLKLRFKIRGMTPKGSKVEPHMVEKIVTSQLLLFKNNEGFYFLIDGNKYYPIYQLVDASTYNTKDGVVFKSMLMRTDVNRVDKVIYDVYGEFYNAPSFILKAFKKKINPIKFYLAAMGFKNTLKYMNMEDIINVSFIREDRDDCYNFPTNSDMFIYVRKYFFDNDYFTRSMVSMLLDAMSKEYMTIHYINQIESWSVELGKDISSDTNPNNLLKCGANFLYSFHRLLDGIIRDELKLRDYNKDNMFAIIRWIMRNYNELKAKDNMDLKYKRIRLSEYLSSYIVHPLNKKLTRFLSHDVKTINDVEDLVKIKLKDLTSKAVASKQPLLRNCIA